MQGSTQTSVVFRVTYAGTDAIADSRVVLFFAPAADPEPRFEVFELDDLRPLFAKDVVGFAFCIFRSPATVEAFTISSSLLLLLLCASSKTSSQAT